MKPGDYAIIQHKSFGEIICKIKRIEIFYEDKWVFYENKQSHKLDPYLIISNITSYEIIDEMQYRLMTS